MVNKDPKAELLALLRARNSPLSGEQLGRELGISRVAVWKQLRTLKALGYPVKTCGAGYSLEGESDYLHAWEVDSSGFSLAYRTVVESTMKEAKGLASGEKPAERVVAAGSQSSGRGRMGRAWDSGEGGLYFTAALDRRIPLGILPRYILFAAAVCSEILRELFSLPASAKWPNDILADGLKIGGVLLDAEIAGDVTEKIYLGVGLNVNNLPISAEAVSVAGLLGRKAPRRRILELFLRELAATTAAPRLDDAPARWRAVSATLGKTVEAETAWGERFRGKASDVDPGGALLLSTGRSGTKRIVFADCRHISMKGTS